MLSEEDQVALVSDLALNREIENRFDEMSLALRTSLEESQPDTFKEAMDEVCSLEVVSVQSNEANPDGVETITKSKIKLTDRYGDWLWQLNRLGVKNLESNTPIPEPQFSRLKNIWEFDSRHESAVMGHIPQGHTYLPFGPGSRNEVLIDLPTSEMMRWIWGDCYHIIILIERKDLANGRFDRIQTDVLN